MRCALLVLFATISITVASEIATPENVSALIKSLDDDDFETRQRSESGLESFGSAVVPLLKRSADEKSLSFETQSRCRRIVQNIALIEKISAMLKEPDGYSKLLAFASEQQKAGRMGLARAICVRAAPLLLKLAEADAQNASAHREHADFLEACAQEIEYRPICVGWEWADPQYHGQIVFLPEALPVKIAGPDIDPPDIDNDRFILNVNFVLDFDIDDLNN